MAFTKRLEDFRIYYNHTIHPELIRMELHRKRLIRLFIFSFLILLGIIAFELFIGVLALTLVIAIPIVVYIAWLIYQAQKFRQNFKPRIVRLLLDFIDDSSSYGTLSYAAKDFLPKSLFLSAGIFETKAQVYEGEDYIKGSIGNLAFEMCELLVQESSLVHGKLQNVFKGIFLRSHLDRKDAIEGQLIILPRNKRQFLARSIRTLLDKGGKNIDDRLFYAPYLESFLTYAKLPEGGAIGRVLPNEVQEIIENYRASTQRDIYISFVNSTINIFFSEPNDFLEPYLFKSIVSFELVIDFFKDIQLVMDLVEQFDRYY